MDVCNICSSGTTGHTFNSDLDCNGVCGGGALEDICGVCDGPGTVSCWNGSLVCDASDCPFNPGACPNGTTGTPAGTLNQYNNACVPTDFAMVNQSYLQASYTITSVTINEEPVDADDWVGTFNGNVCVGAMQWDTSGCGNGICSVSAVGFYAQEEETTAGYMQAGDIPTFQIYDASANMYFVAQASENIPWGNNQIIFIESLNSINPLSIYDGTIPDTYSIYNIYPNPFNPITRIEYSLPENASIELIIYNIHGRHIQTLIQGFQTAGYHSINWNASNYSSGVYLIRLESSIYSKTQKVVLIR